MFLKHSSFEHPPPSYFSRSFQCADLCLTQYIDKTITRYRQSKIFICLDRRERQRTKHTDERIGFLFISEMEIIYVYRYVQGNEKE